MDEIIKVMGSILGTVVTYLWGGVDVAMGFLLVAIVIDYLTGVIRSYIKHDLCSETGFKGIVKKLSMLLIVTVAVIIDALTIGNGLLRLVIIYYFVANECLSILENLGEAGVPIPKKLKQAIKAFQKENNSK